MQQRRRSWLCVAYAFPPISRSGTHRTAAFVRHLHQQGWDADVLTVNPDGEAVDAELLATVPDSVRVHRAHWTNLIAAAKRPFCTPSTSNSSGSDASTTNETHSNRGQGWREWCSRLLQTPDSRLGWIPYAVAKGVRCIRRHRPDVLYSTSPYASAHLSALVLHRMYRIPWVADFRDPWVGNPYADTTFRSIAKWNSLLEHAVVQAASAVVCNTSTLREAIVRRHPRLEEKSHAIPNGVDLDLFREVVGTLAAAPDTFVLLHAGQFYGPRKPTLLFEALRRAIERLPASKKVVLALMGSESYEGRPLKELALSAGIGEQVQVLGTRPHRQTLAHLVGADALLLMGAGGPGAELQVPNKLFEYLGARRPILAVVSAGSPSVGILRDSFAEAVVCNPDDTESLARGIVNLVCGTYDRPAEPWRGVEKFDRAHRADELRELFEALALLREPLRGSWLDQRNKIATLSGSREAFTCG